MHTTVTGAVFALSDKVPHLIKPAAQQEWLSQFMLAMLIVLIVDRWADKIPGVTKLWNRIPQVIVLVVTAVAVSTLQDVPLINTLTTQLVDLSNRLAVGLSLTWNIGGSIVAGVVAFIFGRKYMRSEKLVWDGLLFGLIMAVVSVLVPWIAMALEFLRYSLLTGIGNIIVIVAGWAGERKIS